MSKVFPSPAAALEGLLFDGMTIMSGGSGLEQNPQGTLAERMRAGVAG